MQTMYFSIACVEKSIFECSYFLRDLRCLEKL